jgi:O-antigen/teichoic acid export membrane protein
MKRGVMYLTIANISIVGGGYLANLFLARFLGPSLYGTYGVITSLMTALNIVQTSGTPQGLSKFVSENPTEHEVILYTSLKLQFFTMFGLGVIFVLISPLVAKAFHDQAFIKYMALMAFIFPTYGLMSIYIGYYNGLHRFSKQSLLTISYAISKLFFIVGLSYFFSIYGVIVGFIIAPLVTLFFGFHWPKKQSDTYSYRRIIRYSLPLVTYTIMATLQISIDLFAVKAISDNNAISGYYAASQNVAIITLFGTSAIGQIVFPRISHLSSKNKNKDAKLLISSSVRLLLLILAPMVALIAGGANQIVKILFGNKYIYAAPILRILVISYTGIVVFSLFCSILNGSGYVKRTTLIAFIGFLTTLFGSIILIPKLGGQGAAISVGAGGAITTVISGLYIKRLFEINFDLLMITKITFTSCLIFILALLGSGFGLLAILWWIFLILIYISILLILKEINVSEIQKIILPIRSWLILKGKSW